MNKTCKSCLKVKGLSAFYKRASSSDGLQPWCKDCSNGKSAERFKSTREEHYLNNKVRFKATFEWYKELKDNQPCVDCKVRYRYYQLDYDHRDPSDKRDHVSSLLPNGRSAVLEEIAKCDLVCKNCHAKRTYSRA